MENNGSKFQEMILEDRSNREVKSWRGKLIEYLELVKQDPGVAGLAHARLNNIILKAGVADIHDLDDLHAKRLFKDESFKVYGFFADDFFGIEKTLSQIARYFHSVALKGVDRQLFVR